MCYLIAKNKNVYGCIALKTRHGSHLVEMKRRMVKVKSFAPRQIQRRLFAALVTLSRKVF